MHRAYLASAVQQAEDEVSGICWKCFSYVGVDYVEASHNCSLSEDVEWNPDERPRQRPEQERDAQEAGEDEVARQQDGAAALKVLYLKGL